MLSPLKPLLCRHDFRWSERLQVECCRRCGKTQTASAVSALAVLAAPDGSAALVAGPEPEAWDPHMFDLPALDPVAPAVAPAAGACPSDKVLRGEAADRRANLLALLDWIAEGGQPSREDALDALLAIIEDAHSAEPVLFGRRAVDYFAKLYEARRGRPT